MALDGGGRRYDGGGAVRCLGGGKSQDGRCRQVVVVVVDMERGTSESGGADAGGGVLLPTPTPGKQAQLGSTHMNSGLRLPAPVFSAKWLPFGFLTISLHGQSRGAPRHPLPCHDLEAPGWWSSCPRGRVTSGPDTDCGFSPTRAAVHGWTKKREDSRRGASSCGTPGSALGCDFEWEPGAHQEVEFKRETPGCGALAVAGR